MRVIVNGIEEDIAESVSLDRYLEDRGLDRRFLVVEHNGNPLAREDFSDVVLGEDDRLELVRPVAGG